MPIKNRKSEHIRTCLERPVEFEKGNGFDRYEFIHKALPEMGFNEIDVSTKFLGKRFEAPFLIEAMTGGTKEAENINKNLALAADKTGIGMGVGSQRIAVLQPSIIRTYKVRGFAPNIFLLGNIGATQLLEYDLNKIENLVKSIKADGLAIHLNAVQEVIQKEGNRNWKGVLGAIRMACSSFDFPVIVKETGCGISSEVALELANAGVAAIDIAGAGGTSWVKVEYYRNKGPEFSKAFFEWGIPTADCLYECAKTIEIPIIASGGIRNGLDAAKAMAIGSSLVGFALPLLKPATKSSVAVKDKIEQLILELKTAMFLIGAKNLQELRRIKIARVK